MSTNIERAPDRNNSDAGDIDRQFAPFVDKMQQEGLPEIAIRTFRYYYEQLLQGGTGYIFNEEAQPVASLPDVADLSVHHAAGQAALDRAVVIKLNGGLGTSMGMEGPKSLIEVKEGLTFLDIIVRQILHIRRETNSRLPLILMNSFNTRTQSLQALEAYPEIASDVPLDFVQHKVPKIWKDDLSPASWPQDTEKEWCPPGHGDIYLALLTSGMLEKLLAAGYEYAFVSNSDNLGATMNVDILGYFAEKNLPFLMEVTDRTAADRKGGHLAWNEEKGLLLREIAQCPPEELDAFQDIERYRYFNTNNLWIHLPTLQETLEARDGVLGLTMIRNEKPVDPTEPDSPRVYQLETAMGLALTTFPEAQAVRVSRSRFLPVKKSPDLLALWSDAYVLTDDYRVHLNPKRQEATPPLGEPLVELDEQYYALFPNLQKHFPHGAPSLLWCRSLTVEGNVYFGADVAVEGDVAIVHRGDEPLYIADGETLSGS